MTVLELLCDMLEGGVSPDAELCVVDTSGKWWPTCNMSFDGESLLIEACDHSESDGELNEGK